MPFPKPTPGLVIHYAYLWREEANQEREENAKDRPCVVVLAVEDVGGVLKVHVAPITHTPPHDPSDAVELPAGTKRRLGLDDERSWISARETNVFTWPGPDIRPVDHGSFAYGLIAGDTFRKLQDAIIANIKAKRAKAVPRSK